VHSVKRLTTSLVCVFLLTSCRGKSGQNVVESPVLRSITVFPPSATIAVGQTQQFTAAANFSDGSSKPLAEATWTTSAPTLANASSNGLVTAVGEGRFTVSATFEKMTGTATLIAELGSRTAAQEPASRCPAASKEIQATCREITYKDLPEGARDLLRELKCNTRPEGPYDSGSAVDLNGDGVPEYEFCCHEAPHGPCGAVLIGKVGTEWKDLTAGNGMLGFEGACNGLVVLETQHNGFHDICLPAECSPVSTPGTCDPTQWRFDGTRYRAAEAAKRTGE
jgi:hypothetical protein